MKRGSFHPFSFAECLKTLSLKRTKELLMSKFSDLLFIGGTGRSGTTIAGKLLSRHERIILAKPTEIKFLTSGNGLLDLYRDPLISRTGKISLGKNSNFEKFKRSVEEKWWSRPGKKGGITGLQSGIDLADWEDLISKLETELKTDRLIACRNFFRDYVDFQKQSEDSIWLDTTPPNLMRAQEISKLLPGSRFLHMIRDGRDVASSVVHEHWGPDSHSKALEWWRQRLIAILKQTEHLNGLVLHVWLEDLVHHDRESTYSKFCDFLNIESDQQMQHYFDTTVVPSESNTGRWKKEVLKSTEFDRRYRKILDELFARGLPQPMRQT